MLGLLSKIILAAVVGCTLVACLIYFKQETLIFHPQRLSANHSFSFPAPFEERFIQSGKVKLHSLRFPKTDSQGVILYFHGNAGSLESWGHVASDFRSTPYDIWVVDYRGYGKSEGSISGESGLHDDAEALHEAAQSLYPGKDIIIYGRSIGTGIAAKLAAKHPPKLLILETPYFNFPDLVSQIAPWAPTPLLRYRLMTNEYIADASFPIHLIHGDRDGLIPMSSSEDLAGLGDHIVFHKVEGAEHNNISAFRRYHQIIRDLLGHG